MNDYLVLMIGIACAGIGGELFVRGLVGLSHWIRLSPGIISVTIAAFATSSPELSVSINAALEASPQLALGDALGSNVVNIAFILAIALIISGIRCPRNSVKRDFPVAIFVPLITGLLVMDGQLSRLDGILLLGVFVVWLITTLIDAKKQQQATAEVAGSHSGWRIVFICLSGLLFLLVSGELIVSGARNIALSFGVDEFIIGATLVAVGTSTPELATAVIAKCRKQDDISLGTLLGSNLFNGLFIVGVAALIHPISVTVREIVAVLVFGLLAVLFSYPTRTDIIKRSQGMLLLVLYAAYLTIMIQH